jgi:ATP-dependent Clp protease adapter protein ClpS
MGRLMAKPGIVIEPDIHQSDSASRTDGWIVTVFNNEYNTYDEVMAILLIATRCTPDEAYIETWEIDHMGKSVVHSGAENVCREVAAIIEKIGIHVEVSQE